MGLGTQKIKRPIPVTRQGLDPLNLLELQGLLDPLNLLELLLLLLLLFTIDLATDEGMPARRRLLSDSSSAYP